MGAVTNSKFYTGNGKSGESRVNQLKTIQYVPQNVVSMYQAAANHVGRSDESAESKRGESHKAHVASVDADEVYDVRTMLRND